MLLFANSVTVKIIINFMCYSTGHVQVLQKTQVTLCASRKFEDNSYVGLVQHKKYTAHKRLLMS